MGEITIEEGNRRLLVLASFLDTIDPARFAFNSFGTGEPSCPTTACALGWCPFIPEFSELVELYMDAEGTIGVRERREEDRDECWDAFYDSLCTARRLFALDKQQAAFVFLPRETYCGEDSPLGLASAAEVAAHIRRFVKRRAE